MLYRILKPNDKAFFVFYKFKICGLVVIFSRKSNSQRFEVKTNKLRRCLQNKEKGNTLYNFRISN